MMTGTTDIATLLTNLGVEVKRAGEREISAKCPVHLRTTGREDNSPSWSMNAETGLWICYSCNARGTLPQLVGELTGEADSIKAVQTLLLQSGIERLTLPDRVETEPPVDWVSYYQFSDVPSRILNKRMISPEMAKHYGIRYDRGSSAIVVPIVSRFGELMGWQEKGTSWVRNRPTGVNKSRTLFGIERFTSKTAVLVESPLDVARFASSIEGPQALATFGAYVSKEQARLIADVADKLIIAFDNDKAGKEGAINLLKYLPRLKRGIHWLPYKTKVKDIGEMNDDQLAEELCHTSVLPWWV